MYPKQSGYPTQPSAVDATQQYAQAPAQQVAMPVAAPLASLQYSEEDKALMRRNGIKMIVAYVIGIICFTLGLPLLINGAVQTAVGNFEGALSIAFITSGSILMVVAVCMLVLGLILLGRMRADEAELKRKRDQRLQTHQQSTQFQGAYTNAAFPSSF